MTAGMQTEKPIQAARLLENRVAIITGASRGIGASEPARFITGTYLMVNGGSQMQ